MKTRLPLAVGFALIAFTPGLSMAADNARKKAEKEDIRLADKCAKEAAKDLRDDERGRTHPRPDNKWDALCAPPPPPPAIEPAAEVVVPPGLTPPMQPM